jgi:hypothetical protein
MKICPKLEEECLSEKFPAEMEFCKIDPWPAESGSPDEPVSSETPAFETPADKLRRGLAGGQHRGHEDANQCEQPHLKSGGKKVARGFRGRRG